VNALLQSCRLLADGCLRFLRHAAWPIVDLALRLQLAGVFYASGIVKLTNWQTALYLSANEYPVSWLDPVTAAYVGVSIELGGAILLAAGLMTRYAALAMLGLSLTIQLHYLALDRHLFWAALFGWYAIVGAGPISLDHLLRRGVQDSALPLVPALARATEWIRSHLGPVYRSLLRLWLATALVLGAAAAVIAANGSAAASSLVASGGVAQWLPLHAAAALPVATALAIGVLLAIGLATRMAAAVAVLALLTRAAIGAPIANPTYLLALFALLLVQGAGPISLDRLIQARIARRTATAQAGAWAGGSVSGDRPRIVIVGAGFGGIACAAGLRGIRASVTLIDRANYHLFQPLLYQVATAALSPGDIAAPVRALFRDDFHLQVQLGTVTGVDAAGREVAVGGRRVPFDYLVIATGAAHSYFGKDRWAPFAPGLKRIEDATEIRRRILTAFERAEVTESPAERAALLTFLIVGGGPTGVELAGAIAELARYGMDKDFRRFDPASARVILVQSAPRILPTFAEGLAARAQGALERLGVEILTGSRVDDIDAVGVAVGGKRIAARTVLWAAGVMASPAATWLAAKADAAGRLMVAPDLSVPGWPNVFVVGDAALSSGWHGQVVPGLAPAAKQGGAYAARVIRSRLAGRKAPPPFAYRHLGSLATIGRKAAVADFGFLRLWGAPAWWLWGAVHVGFLVGLRNRLSTMVNWFWSYLTYRGGIRLITGGSGDEST
jgi:NADH dehydrogenase/putative oxidoreductase